MRVLVVAARMEGQLMAQAVWFSHRLGPFETSRDVRYVGAVGGKAHIVQP